MIFDMASFDVSFHSFLIYETNSKYLNIYYFIGCSACISSCFLRYLLVCTCLRSWLWSHSVLFNNRSTFLFFLCIYSIIVISHILRLLLVLHLVPSSVNSGDNLSRIIYISGISYQTGSTYKYFTASKVTYRCQVFPSIFLLLDFLEDRFITPLYVFQEWGFSDLYYFCKFCFGDYL